MAFDEMINQCKLKIDNRKNEIEEESFAKTLLRSYEKANRRIFIICILLVGICAYMMWERSQYDYSSYTVEQSIDENGVANYIGEQGDIVNGETDSN